MRVAGLGARVLACLGCFGGICSPPSLKLRRQDDFGNPPSTQQLNVILDGIIQYYACVLASPVHPGCSLSLEEKAELQGWYFELLSLASDGCIVMADLGSQPGATGAMTAPDLVDDGSWSNGSGIDAWTADRPNAIVMNENLTGVFLNPCVYGALLFHEASHFDDSYTFVNGSPATPGDQCLFAIEEVKARKLEMCLLECCQQLCELEQEEAYEVGLRIGHMPAFIDQAKQECEDACGICPPTPDCLYDG